jgi:hypothetical protein
VKIDENDRLLFLKYALPCAGTLVRRGNVSQQYVDSLISVVSAGETPVEDAQSMFKVANAMCSGIAERMGKEKVDCEVIRQYFLLEHSEVVLDRYRLMKDFDPIDCNTYKGRVMSVDGGFAVVNTKLGERKYRTDFVPGICAGDRVVVHWDFVVERVPQDFAARMGELE